MVFVLRKISVQNTIFLIQLCFVYEDKVGRMLMIFKDQYYSLVI